MVTEEEVLAMLRTILMPILARYLDGRSLRVLIPSIFNLMLVKPSKYFITSFHTTKIGKKQQLVADVK
jgi:hypothetical protein